MFDKYYNSDYQDTSTEEQVSEIITGSGGGGGCFPAGTFVRTQHGTKPIEKCRPNDLIITYDRFGEIELGAVLELQIHEVGTYADDLYFIYSNNISLFPKGITGNHAVYNHLTKEHKEISDFVLGDKLVQLDGELVEITEIKITANEDIGEKVYNLEVYPQHTYLVQNELDYIRVHNGGGGKADSGTPRQAQEAPNTLQSSTKARILEILSHGEIVGIVGGAKGVFFNNTVLENPDSSRNFPGAIFDERVGLPSQTHIPGFSDIESEIVLAGTEITAAGIVEQLPNSNVESARVTLAFPDGLWKQNKSNGDLNGFTVNYTIETREIGAASWNIVLNKIITDKTTSAWEVAHRISAPVGATQWEIRVKRISQVDQDSAEQSAVHWARITEINEETLSYDNIAYAGLIVPAKSTGNQIPTRAYDVMGLKVKVPFNYDTTLRTYGTDFWNGSFKIEWTDNPAWVLYDLITNPEYGMENFLNQPVDVDIWAFYEASLYNDAASWNGSSYDYNLLDDGDGGTEVRYTFNTVIQTQQDAWQLLHAVASNMRATLVMNGAQISILQDRPRISKKIINNSNVIEGLFVYSGTESTSRATAVNCTFNDKQDRYLPRTITEEDDIAIAKFGYTVRDIVAYGSVKESEARRHAKWMLHTEISQPDIVNFSMSLNIIDLSVGDVVSIMDDDFISDNNKYLTGRVKSETGTNVVLDRAVTLDAGFTYIFGVMDNDYTAIIERTITTGAGDVSSVDLDTTLPAGDYVNHEYFCYSVGHVEPRDFLIQVISESEKGIYSLTALVYDDSKFAAIESGIVAPALTPPTLLSPFLPSVENIVFQEVFLNTGISKENYIYVQWDWDEANPNSDQVTFSLRWRRDNEVYHFVPDIPTKDYQIQSIIPGVYEVIIEATNLQGKKSLSTTSSYNYRTVGANSTLAPPENFFVKDTAGVAFVDNHIAVEWTFPLANETTTDTLLDYILEVWTKDGITKKSTHVIQPDSNRDGSFDYTIELNINDFVTPTREVQMKLYSRDAVGDLSLPITKNFDNVVPAIPGVAFLVGSSVTYIDITPPAENDLAGFIIYRSETEGFTPVPGDIIYDGPDTYITLQGTGGTTYYYRIAAYDTFGKTNLNLTTEDTAIPLISEVPIWVFEGLVFKPDDPTADDVSWTAGTASVDGGAPVSLNANNATWTTGILYIYYSGSGAELSTTTDIAVAVTGVIVLATYKGGTSLIVGNGDAFTDGGLILANTIGANQLVVDSAIITNIAQLQAAIIRTVHIQDGNITNAKIGNTIQSADWDDIGFEGWKIDKAGNIISYGSIELRDAENNIILTTGPAAQLEWDAVGGINVPADNADVTQANLAGSGINLAHPLYSSFELDVLPTIVAANNLTISLETAISFFGANSLKGVTTAVDPHIYLAATALDYHIPILPNRKWIVSAYVRSSAASADGQLFVRTDDADAFYSGNFTQDATINTWKRVSASIDLTADNSTNCLLRIDFGQALFPETVYVDGLMIEEQLGDLTIPSPYTPPPANSWENISKIPYDSVFNNDDSVALGYNPTFAAWAEANTYPDGWAIWTGAAPTKETTIVRIGANSAKFITPVSTNQGMLKTVDFGAPMAIGTFIAGSVDIYLGARVSGLPGITVRLFTNAALTTFVQTLVQPETTALGVWQRVPFTARVGITEQIHGMTIYVMASWGSFASGNFEGTSYFDNMRFAFYDNTTDNTDITINSSGSLSGAGSGSVTITGLGYTGALDATLGATWGTDVGNQPAVLGSNLIYNAGAKAGSSDGWFEWENGAPSEFTYVVDHPNWNIGDAGAPYGTFGIHQIGTSAFVGQFHLDVTRRAPVIEGQRYEASVYSGAHRCLARILISWYDSAGVLISTSAGIASEAQNDKEASGGITLAGYKRLFIFATAPTNAVTVSFVMRKEATQSPDTDSWGFFTLPYLGEAGTNQTELSAWSEGASNNVSETIQGQGGFATLDQITPANVTTYIANLAVKTAQIALLAVGTGNIINLAVETIKIKDQAVTIPLSAFTTGTLTLSGPYASVQSIEIVSTGAPIQILGSFEMLLPLFFDTGTGGPLKWKWTVGVRLVRDTTVLTTHVDLVQSPVITYVDNPGAGTYTYHLEAAWLVNFSGAKQIKDRFLSVLEVKK